MVKKVLLLSGFALSGMLSASDPEAQLINSIRNFQNLVEKIEEEIKKNAKTDLSTLPMIKSAFDHDIRTKSDNALFSGSLDGKKYFSYCRQFSALNEQLDLLVIQQKNV